MRPSVIAGAVLLSPMVPFEPEQPPVLAGKPVMIVYGRHDPLAPPEQPRRLCEILASGGADVQVLETDEGHSIAVSSLGPIREWITQHFGGD
jgi:predicted esterase